MVKSIIEKNEVFAFEDLEDGVLEKLQAEDEEYPGYATPISELVARFEKEGFRVASGEKGGVVNLRAIPNRIEDDGWKDSVLVRNLKITEGMDSALKAYIVNSRSLKAE